MFHLNYIHVLVVTLIYFVIGALWYSLIFQKAWMKLVGATGELSEEAKKRMPLMFATTFVLNFMIVFATACILHVVNPATLWGATKIGILLSGGYVGTSTMMNNMYAMRPFKLTLIDSGYHIFAVTLSAIILQMWH